MKMLLCVVLASVAVAAQDAAGPRFDAASIKRNTARSGTAGGSTTPNQIHATNVPLGWLILRAYGLQEYQVIGAPEWTRTERYDVTARAEKAEPKQLEAMLRNMLADRFQLAGRTETREMPVYALVPTRPGQLGPKLTKTVVEDCRKAQFCGSNTSATAMRSVSETMARLAALLSPLAGRTVIDRTGLEGRYDYELTWSSDAVRPPRPNDDGASIFTALQEQLGLKLDAQRGPVEVLVIDRIERPTED